MKSCHDCFNMEYFVSTCNKVWFNKKYSILKQLYICMLLSLEQAANHSHWPCYEVGCVILNYKSYNVLFLFQAMYLPWVLLAFNMIIGQGWGFFFFPSYHMKMFWYCVYLNKIFCLFIISNLIVKILCVLPGNHDQEGRL